MAKLEEMERLLREAHAEKHCMLEHKVAHMHTYTCMAHTHKYTGRQTDRCVVVCRSASRK